MHGAACAGIVARVAKPATLILIHGAWHGAWCWQRLAPLLEAQGRRVVAPDLPSMGEDQTPATDVTLEAVQLFGVNGYMAEFRVEQLCRDAKVLQIYGGTDEIQISQIARSLLKDN